MGEAVVIMRKGADNETYFLAALVEDLNQLAGYFAEQGNTERASAVTSAVAEVRAKIASLPPEPDFLFEELNSRGSRRSRSMSLKISPEDVEVQDFSSTVLAVASGEISVHAVEETPANSRLTRALATSLEAKIEMKAKDILWSIFLVILGWGFCIVWSSN